MVGRETSLSIAATSVTHASSVTAAVLLLSPHLCRQIFVPPLTSWAVTGGTCEKPLDERSSHLVTVMLFGLHSQT